MYNCVSPVQGITGAYQGHSLAVQASVASLLGCAVYGALELIALIFSIFNGYRGLYFWSLLLSGLFGVIPDALGLAIKYFELGPIWVAVTLSTSGWFIMVTGQSLVLYSRLHLVVLNTKVLRFVLCMIIFNAIVLSIPQIIASYGAIYACRYQFGVFFNYWEKVQITTLFTQEVIISTIFIVQATRLLRLYPTLNKQRTEIMHQLLAINAAIILMDISIVVLEFKGLFIIQTSLKCFFYVIKLKLEMAVLSRLASVVQIHVQGSSGLSEIS
ncbi:hypothetical protein N7495_001109 [Penicillium taxi]|uniref:uncharacterized protein n=1 Tax=Penicillium taxi TaxID=168475 RepID=UPI00254564EB|nr:uncharacterized protein N7495_001109 [Penicillium taxi]KAJ5908427.1 hypothetical protein N7495_001109 [Penicillium taxi]